MRATIATAAVVLGAFWMLSAQAIAEDTPAPTSDGPEASSEAATTAAQPRGPTFTYQSGDILLPNKTATLHLGEKYRYLDPPETSKLLVAWGNPPSPDTQGAIVPSDVDPMDGDTGWAVILRYKDDGHVDDADAAKIDYDDMLKDLKEGTAEANEARKQQGYQAMNLIGWAEKPHYDSAAKKLYWAKEIDFEGDSAHTLNYDVRVLGREGVLSMNAISTMDHIEQIRSDMRPLIETAEFNEGYRYAEFNSKTDRVAEYGLAALIAGGIAAKTGLLAKIGLWLLAAKKFIIMGLVAIGAFFKKLFGKKDANA